MIWKCPQCGGSVSKDLLVCGRCSTSRPDDAEFRKSEEDERIEAYSRMPAPSFATRMVSPAARMRRIDFALVLLLAVTLQLAAIATIGIEVAEALRIRPILALLSLGVLVFGGVKRCRDLDWNPWISPLVVAFTPSLLALLIMKGTKGANRYGPDPRARHG